MTAELGDIARALDGLMADAGGFVDHPADPGRPRKFGITAAVLSAHRGLAATSDDIARLSYAEAREIYHQRCVIGPGFDRIVDRRLRRLLIDSAAEHGPRRATKWLQAAAGAIPDGVMGPSSHRAVAMADPERLYQQVLARRLVFLGRRLARHPAQAVFAFRWLRRVAAFIEES